MKEFLSLSALILSIINGLMLLKYYFSDRPRLKVEPIHPGTYQWWFRLPNGKLNDSPTRKYGFLAYVGICNKGLRKVALSSWRLYITVALKQIELKALSIPEPQADLSKTGHVKTWPVLGQKSLSYSGDTLIDSGASISGMAYYVVEFYGSEKYNPLIINGKIFCKFMIRDVFGNRAATKIVFHETTLEKIKVMVENIEMIH